MTFKYAIREEYVVVREVCGTTVIRVSVPLSEIQQKQALPRVCQPLVKLPGVKKSEAVVKVDVGSRQVIVTYPRMGQNSEGYEIKLSPLSQCYEDNTSKTSSE